MTKHPGSAAALPGCFCLYSQYCKLFDEGTVAPAAVNALPGCQRDGGLVLDGKGQLRIQRGVDLLVEVDVIGLQRLRKLDGSTGIGVGVVLNDDIHIRAHRLADGGNAGNAQPQRIQRGGAAVVRGKQRHVFPNALPRQQTRLLKQEFDRRVCGLDLLSIDLHSAGGGGVQLGDDAQQGAFAAAGAPYDSNKFAGGYGQVYAFQHLMIPELLGDAAQRKARCSCCGHGQPLPSLRQTSSLRSRSEAS